MTYLQRSLAMFLGATVLPLRSIYYGLEFTVAALFAAVVSLIGVPVFASYFFYRSGFSWPVNLLLSIFVAIPSSAVLVSLGLVVAASYLVYTTVIDVFKMIWLGLKNGFIDGIDGFWRTWNHQRSPLSLVSNHVRAYYNGVRVDDQINNEDDFNELHMSMDETEPMDATDSLNLADVPCKMLEIPDIQDSVQPLLTAEEERDAENLIKECSALNIPLSAGLKEQIKLLSTRTDNYKELFKHVSSVKNAITANDLSELQDQLIEGLEVTTPIIVIKQYQTPDNKWHSVPANSHVSDKNNFLTWLKEKSTHPLNNDVLKSPTPYEGRPARYRWDLLTIHNCFLVQELNEGAAIIRNLLNTLPAQLTTVKENISSPGSSPQALFAMDSLRISQEKRVDERVVEFNPPEQRVSV